MTRVLPQEYVADATDRMIPLTNTCRVHRAPSAITERRGPTPLVDDDDDDA